MSLLRLELAPSIVGVATDVVIFVVNSDVVDESLVDSTVVVVIGIGVVVRCGRQVTL